MSEHGTPRRPRPRHGAACGGSLTPEIHRQAAEPREHPLPIPFDLVLEQARAGRQDVEDRLEHEGELGPGHVRPEAIVRAMAEDRETARVPADVEAVGIGKDLGVAMGPKKTQQQS